MPLEDGVELARVQNSGFNELLDAGEILGASGSQGYAGQMLGGDHLGADAFHFGLDGLLERFLVQSVAGREKLHRPSFNNQVLLLGFVAARSEVLQRQQIGEAVKASPEAREAPRVAHPVECFGVNTEAECIFRSDHTSMLPEDAPGARGAVSAWSS